jgi:glycogen synthase
MISCSLDSISLQRLLFVTPRYFPYTGGVENHVYQVARRLAEAGVDVTVLTTNPGGTLAAYEELEGVKVERVRAWPANRDYYFAPGLYSRIRQGNWDIVHIQSYHTLVAPLAMLAALRARVPYLVTFHGGGHSSRLRNGLRRVQWALLRPLLVRAARLVAVARFEIEIYGKRLGLPESRFSYIPNGSDLPQVTPLPLSKPETENKSGLLIVSVGRLERYKGHQRIIAALPGLLKVRPDARLWIAGSGPYEAALLKQAQKLGVAGRVEIRAIPAQDRAAMARELSKASIVTLLSDYETHPIAVLEAAALGRPVLVANTSGLKELADQGLARAISLKSSPHQVAQAILEQLEQPVSDKALRMPTWDNCASELLSLYQSILGRAACAS